MTTNLRTKVTGIVLGIHPSTERTFAIELRRSTQSSTGSTAWGTEYLNGSSGDFLHRVLLPLSTRTFYFQARHVGIGYSAGTYTPVVSAKPTRIPLAVMIPVVRGKTGAVEVPLGDLWLTSAKTVKVGTQASTATITKTLRIPHAETVPLTNSKTYIFTSVYVQPFNNAGTNLIGSVVVPKGVTINRATARVYRQVSTGALTDKAEIVFVKATTSSTAATTLVTLTHSGASATWQNVSSTMTQVVGDEAYAINVELSPRVAGVGADTRFAYFELQYTMPSYDKGI